MSERNRRRFRYLPSPPMVVALTALLFATAGTAVANHGGPHQAGVVNGLDVQNGSLTGADIRNKSLTFAEFRGRPPTGKIGPRGPAGPAGANGQNGAQGQQGPGGPQGPTGAQGLTGAQGPPGFAQLDRNVGEQSAAAMAQTGLRVDCDPGLFVVGGGVVSDGFYNQTSVNSSFPSSSASWTGFVDNYTSLPIDFRVYVICAPATQVTSVVEAQRK